MFLGHFGLAFGAKPLASKPSLGLLIFAAQFADLVWPILLLAGVERVAIVPGLMAASPMEFINYPITHSLLALAMWGLAIGGLYWLVRQDRRGALVVGLLVVSHWLLDLLMHRPDLPIWPGGPKVGLGLWNSVPGTLLAEALAFGVGVWIYARATVAKDRSGRWGLVGLVVTLVCLYLAVSFGPPPANVTGLAMGGLALWIFVPWGMWIDRHRALRAA
ncbi:MAG: metal-dependent hydrolase [Myxococcaceae bacterium]